MLSSPPLKNKYKLSLRRNDIFVRNMVLVLGAVFIWRGVWNILDHYFFPHDWLLSNLLSVGFGVFLVFLLDEEIKHDMKDEERKEKKLKPTHKFPSKESGSLYE